MNEAVRQAAERLAEFHHEGEENLAEIWWFPAEEEIRLIDVDPTAMPAPEEEEEVHPFRFGPDRESGIPFSSSVAVITPDDKRRLRPPKEWGSWEGAERIWSNNQHRVS